MAESLRSTARNIVGTTHGNLFIIKFLYRDGFSHRIFLCKCICGIELKVSASSILSSQRKNTCRHINTQSPTKISYYAMLNRCYNKRNDSYNNYGKRGITVCDSWRENFNNFLKDMGARPLGTSLERKDSNGNYNKNNCVWATKIEQAQNLSTNRNITFAGLTLCISAWARLLRVNRNAFQSRLNAGYTFSQAASMPYKLRGRPRHTIAERLKQLEV